MRAATLKNSVLSQLDAGVGTDRNYTVKPLPNVDQIVADKATTGQSTGPQPNWRETIPKGRQAWFTVAMVAAAVIVFYVLLKQKVIKL
ncbi:MAG: hypothetical protein R2824_15825 [Saprospiraceae bacterium]|nr:hypothetical protein [Lewinella sp.]